MVQIPEDRRYFRIGEASRIVGVEPYVLRYWEGEFPQIRPRRADSNHRTYQKKDLETILQIKRLLYEEKMTIEGAKMRLSHPAEREQTPGAASILREIRRELREIDRLLRQDPLA
jgi:DNA-binding transcriptional MerR regulator